MLVSAALLHLMLLVGCGDQGKGVGPGVAPPDEGAARGLGHPRNAIIILLDTLRADRLGCYGYERDTSPALDALAARGTCFEQVVSPAPWTLPATGALLSGLPPE